MKEKSIYNFEYGPLEEHPATLMWNIINNSNTVPISIEKLDGLSRKDSLIYRINGIGKNGNSIIAKCASQKRLSSEYIIYEKILPQLTFSKLQYYGFNKEDEGDLCWLFLEEVSGIPYIENNEIHRRLASFWLATMHLSTWKMDVCKELPNIGTERYLIYLNNTNENISRNISNNELTSKDKVILNRIIDLCSLIKGNWGKIEEICDALNPCLVHSDFISKNVRVCNINNEPTLFVFDWEFSGWGIMVEDIGGLDMDIYWSIVKDSKFVNSRRHLQLLSNVGLIFRYLAWIQATSAGLKYRWIEKSMRALSHYEIELANTSKKLEWR